MNVKIKVLKIHSFLNYTEYYTEIKHTSIKTNEKKVFFLRITKKYNLKKYRWRTWDFQ